MTIKVYQYGLRAPTENGDAVERQFRLARRFRNDLIQIERSRRAVVKDVDKADLKLRVGSIRKQYAADSGLAWNTKGLVSAAAEQSFKTSKDVPRFIAARNVDRDRVGGQIEAGKGTPVAELLDGSRPIRIQGDGTVYKTLVLDVSAPFTARSERVFASWPMKMHRQLPADGVVKNVVVTRRTEGPFVRWTCEITVEQATIEEAAPSGVIAIDVGWRKQPDGSLLAATAGDDSEKYEPVKVESRIVNALEKADAVRSTRDSLLNTALGMIKEAMEGCASVGLHWVRKPEGMRRTLEKWSRNRVEGDQHGFDIANLWAHRDMHLWRYEIGMRRTAIRSRKDCFLKFAYRVNRAYATVILEDFDKSSIATKNKGERSNAGRVKAAPSALTLCFPRAVKVNPAYTSKTCSLCRSVEDISSVKEHTCKSCGVTWDRDENACRNLIERWRSEQAPAAARSPKKREAKWARVAREQGERQAEIETSREPCANAAE